MLQVKLMLKKLSVVVAVVLSLGTTQIHAGNVGSVGAKIACVGLGPIAVQAAVLVAAAKEAGVITTRKKCLSKTRTVARITEFVTGDEFTSRLISGVFVQCACILVF